MKAVILAAGKGERLGGYTSTTPKPMIKHLGKPILEHNIGLCKKHGITDLFINVHYLGEKIIDYFRDGRNFGVNITYSVEDELLGTAGAVKRIKERFWEKDCENPEPFFVLYGDNYSDYLLNELIRIHSEFNPLAVIGCHYREDVQTSGVVESDQTGRILRFIEKPLPGQTNSHWVNAGVYFLDQLIFNYIPEGFSDFAKDIFPYLLSLNILIHALKNTSEVNAFDTPEMLKKNLIE